MLICGLGVTALVATGAYGGISAHLASVAGAPNLVSNPSFEQNLTGWGSWSGRLRRIADASAPDGHFVALAEQVSGPSYTIDSWWSRVSAGGAPGRSYTASARVAAGSPSARGKPFRLVLRETTPSGTFVTSWSTPVIPLSGDFESLAVTGATVGSGDLLEVYAVQGHAVSGDSFRLDAASLMLSATPATPVSTVPPATVTPPAPIATMPPASPPAMSPPPTPVVTMAPPPTPVVTMAPPATTPAQPPTPATATGLLQRNGTQLTFNGKPYHYVGVNAYGILGCDNVGDPYSAATLDAFFKSLPAHTLTRMWAYQNLPGNLDTVIQEATANNQMLILSLANEYSDCTETAKDAAWFQSRYQGAYLTYIQQVAAKYKNSPAVGMWEIINEPRASGVDTATMAAFLEASAKAIKSADPNHLVESGTLDEGEPGTTDYRAIHAGADIDVISLHEYDYENGGEIVSNHTANALAAGKALNKPVIIGETGVKASTTDCTSVGGTPNRQARADVFKQKFDGYLAAGVAGVNVWNWFPVQYDGCVYETIYPGDPFMAMLKAYVVP